MKSICNVLLFPRIIPVQESVPHLSHITTLIKQILWTYMPAFWHIHGPVPKIILWGDLCPKSRYFSSGWYVLAITLFGTKRLPCCGKMVWKPKVFYGRSQEQKICLIQMNFFHSTNQLGGQGVRNTTSFQSPKWPQTKMHTISNTVFRHSF